MEFGGISLVTGAAGFDMDADGIASLTSELSSGDHYFTPLDITDRKGILELRDMILLKHMDIKVPAV